METIKFEHWAAYLPYKLKVEFYNDTNVLCAVHFDNKSISIKDDFYTYTQIKPEKLKPLLRPMSQLTTEIEHNGERFVPIDYKPFELSKKDIIDFQNGFLHYKALRFGIIQRLLEWHFDIWGYIPKGLAVEKKD